MESLHKHRPTQFDRSEAAFIPDRANWLVCPVIKTRDSRCLERANFDAFLFDLGGEGEFVEIHRFGHWGPGWYEIIIVKPGTPQAKLAAKIAADLEDYPVVDEELWTEYEITAVSEYWETATMADKVFECARADISIFSARREAVPDGVYHNISCDF